MTPRQVLESLVASLFVNGSGEHADRLVLWCDVDERPMGGWCQRAIVDRLEDGLTQHFRLETRIDKSAEILRKVSRRHRPTTTSPRLRGAKVRL